MHASSEPSVRATCSVPASRLGADHDLLVAEPPLQDRAARRVDHEVIGIHRARHHGFPETRARVDHGVTPAASHRIGGET
jgi:hypothetical protein